MARTRTPTAATLAGRIAQEIRAEMSRQGITQEALATRLGWTQRKISYRLTADHPIDAAELEQIAAALGVDVVQLIPTGTGRATAQWPTVAADRPRPDPHRVDPRRDRQPDRPDDFDRGRRDGQRDRPRAAEAMRAVQRHVARGGA